MGTHPIFESDFDCLTVVRMTRRSSSVQIKSKTVTHQDCRRILDESTKKNFRDSPTKTASPAKVGYEKRKIGKENISSDEDIEERDEEDCDLDHNDAHLFHRRYFESAKRSKTSDKVLMLNRERLQTEMENLKIQTKKKVYDHMFDEWTLYTAQGYSIFLTGLGSKFELMRSYREYQENQGYDTLFINGFLESTTEKMILDAIINDFVQSTSVSPKKTKNDLSQIDTIMNFYQKDDSPLLFIFINNIESGGLSKSFYTLSKLVALEKIKLICSVDKVYGGFVLDQNQYTSFKFLSFDVSTFEPYSIESKAVQSIFAKSSNKVGLASLQHVFDSLTDNGKGVLKLIIKEQINQISKQKEGPTFKELYKLCRKSFLVTSEVGLKAQLVELKDHRLIGDSNDQIRIQLQVAQLENFLSQNV